jgi:hypothetical protein
MSSELDIDALTDEVFSKAPQDPKSICISFDGITLKEVFEALLMFTINGMKMKYSNDHKTVNVAELTEENIIEIKKYLASIGFVLTITDCDNKEWEDIFPYFVQFNNMEYDEYETYLEKYQYHIGKPEINKHLIISFRIL